MYATRRFREDVLPYAVTTPTPRDEWLFRIPPIVNNPISGWHAHVVYAGGYESILLMHNATRFPVLLPAFDDFALAHLNAAFLADTVGALETFGATPADMDTFRSYWRALSFTGQYDRKVQGSLNACGRSLNAIVYFKEIDLAETYGWELSARLADTITRVDNQYICPGTEMLNLIRSLPTPDQWPLLN